MIYISIYITSDLHGDTHHFYLLFQRINIDLKKDKLIINGDIVDRNAGSLGLLFKLLKLRDENPDNIIILKGNHELFLSLYLQRKLPEKQYALYGGESTIKETKFLSEDEKERLTNILNELPLYTVIECENERMVVTHAGLDMEHLIIDKNGMIDVLKSISAAAEYDEFHFLVGNDIFYAPSWVIRNLSITMIVGHMPTIFMEGVQMPIVYQRGGDGKGKSRLICTDCGAGYIDMGGRCAILRIDDETVFYA